LPPSRGRIFRSILWNYYKDIKKATAIASAFGKGFAFFLMGIGFLNLFTGLVIPGIWFIFIGFFLYEAASVSYRQIIIKKMLGGVKVDHLMTKGIISVEANIKLDKLIDDYFFRYRHAAFPVVEDDVLLGLATLHNVKDVKREEWPKTTAKDIMVPLGNELIISKNAHATEAMGKMANNGVGRLLVIENSKMIGIISQKDIMRLFKFKTEINGD
ncbi:MAG: CBS domain-containing protein, partial [Candidatus Margulisiibacteriota bacterium]|nr:CBS domain-containing protein [Candidatus Margulisiibacteriota bacterium]